MIRLLLAISPGLLASTKPLYWGQFLLYWFTFVILVMSFELIHFLVEQKTEDLPVKVKILKWVVLNYLNKFKKNSMFLVKWLNGTMVLWWNVTMAIWSNPNDKMVIWYNHKMGFYSHKWIYSLLFTRLHPLLSDKM